MRYKIIHEAHAEVTLTDRERVVLQSWCGIPMIYSPGGMGPEMPVGTNNTIKFGGACFVDARKCLDACLEKFRDALIVAMARADDRRAEGDALAAGFRAFPAGRYMDAMRGTKNFPDHPKCPYRKDNLVAAWKRGYDEALGEVLVEEAA